MSTLIRVLILEDRPEDAELMIHELRRCQFDPQWWRVDTESEFNAHLGSRPDVILSDYNMPLLDSPRALELMRELGLDIPFIVVSGAIGEDVAVAMMRRGATDYLLKDRLTRLGPAVRRALDEKKLRDQTRQAEKALRASEVRFDAFMNHSPALAFIKDEHGRILYMNNTCEHVWGKTLAECLGKANHDLWPARLADQFAARDAAALGRGETSQLVEEASLPDGRDLHLLSFRFPFSDVEGRRLLGVVSVDVSEQVRSERALSRALAAKEVLLRELHHRVKNNLQVVSSLLTMQAGSLQNSNTVNALERTRERVECMAMIHERLQGDHDADRVDFREYAGALARDLLHAHGAETDRILLKLDLEPLTLELSQAIPCGLILNELLTNALKHAFPDGRSGEIRIALACGQDERVRLTVSDNGIGGIANPGTQKPSSLGLRIVDVLSRQLDGEVRQDAGAGASFSIVFPRSESSPKTRRPPQREEHRLDQKRASAG